MTFLYTLLTTLLLYSTPLFGYSDREEEYFRSRDLAKANHALYPRSKKLEYRFNVKEIDRAPTFTLDRFNPCDPIPTPEPTPSAPQECSLFATDTRIRVEKMDGTSIGYIGKQVVGVYNSIVWTAERADAATFSFGLEDILTSILATEPYLGHYKYLGMILDENYNNLIYPTEYVPYDSMWQNRGSTFFGDSQGLVLSTLWSIGEGNTVIPHMKTDDSSAWNPYELWMAGGWIAAAANYEGLRDLQSESTYQVRFVLDCEVVENTVSTITEY